MEKTKSRARTTTGPKPAPGEPRSEWTLDDFMAEGTRRFGEDKLKWKFVCPICGHEQSIEDFRPFKDRGATPETARFNCIGRFAGAKREALGGKGPGPCNYTSGGLFDLRPWTVQEADGKPIRTFAFAKAA